MLRIDTVIIHTITGGTLEERKAEARRLVEAAPAEALIGVRTVNRGEPLIEVRLRGDLTD